MGADPEPHQGVGSLDRERPMTQANANREESPHFLEVERGVSRIGLQKSERFVGKFASGLGQGAVASPEIGSG